MSDRDCGEIAALLGKSEAACRQMVHRAGERVRRQQPRVEPPPRAGDIHAGGAIEALRNVGFRNPVPEGPPGAR